jgi:hypothetical protein
MDYKWFKYDQDYLCVNKSQFVPVIFEPPCIYLYNLAFKRHDYVTIQIMNTEQTAFNHGLDTEIYTGFHV